jgi:hypothetical protein
MAAAAVVRDLLVRLEDRALLGLGSTEETHLSKELLVHQAAVRALEEMVETLLPILLVTVAQVSHLQ